MKKEYFSGKLGFWFLILGQLGKEKPLCGIQNLYLMGMGVGRLSGCPVVELSGYPVVELSADGVQLLEKVRLGQRNVGL